MNFIKRFIKKIKSRFCWKEYLPLGSVVLLYGVKVMIYGRKQILIDTGVEYDYRGCAYPEGYINNKNVCVFNHSLIEKVIFKGYVNEVELELMKTWKEGNLWDVRDI